MSIETIMVSKQGVVAAPKGDTPPLQEPSKLIATVLIIGGGAAGITVAAGLRRRRPDLSITLVDASETHAYQPGWTLVGAGVFTLSQTLRREEAVIPKGVTWIKAAVSAVEADTNEVRLTDGRCITYRYLVVCPGLQLNWDEIEGLRETIGKNGVCSNYAKETVEYTWSCLELRRRSCISPPIIGAGVAWRKLQISSSVLRVKRCSACLSSFPHCKRL
jgi:hypothetical protein